MAEMKPAGSSTLAPDDVAVVCNREGGYQILVPNPDHVNDLPEQAVILVAVGMRLTDDSEFYEDMKNWFAARHG